MPRYGVSGRATIVGTSTMPLVSIYATAGVRPGIVEIGLWNTTATALDVAVVRLATTGTPGSALAIDGVDMPESPATATAFNGHTVAPTIGKEHRRATLGAAVGSGVIWTWPLEARLTIPAATTNGVGIIVPVGTGQIMNFYLVWIE